MQRTYTSGIRRGSAREVQDPLDSHDYSISRYSWLPQFSSVHYKGRAYLVVLGARPRDSPNR